MISTVRENRSSGSVDVFRGTCSEFALVLRSLGAGIESRYGPESSRRPCRVRLDCRRDEWRSAVGELPTHADHFGPAGHRACEMWEYQCDDGRVLCIGQRRRTASGQELVSVTAVSFSDEPA